MLYIVFLTGVCNLRCRYCGGTIPEEVMPHEIEYSVDVLKEFVMKDEEPVIAFYGGEPLLRIKKMMEIMDTVPAKKFVVQTNGFFLHQVPRDYLNRLDAILVSIDGIREVTDFYRGKGVYDIVVDRVNKIRSSYRGDIIARMAVSEESDIYRDVRHLLSLPFDHVHWQLNVVWAPDDSWHDFDRWVNGSYNPGITRLADWWIEEIKDGRIPGIVPFQGVIKRMLFHETGLPCGAGRNAFAIATDGRVLACPIGGEYEWNNLGTIWNRTPATLRNSVEIDEPCRSCDIYNICGGRCLFANKERYWGMEGFAKICGTVRHLVKEMERARKVIEELIEEGKYQMQDFNYPPFNNTTEIIP
ncbi:MAG: TIGR04084 family radical SAM/SPASM domain-containing protein [Euryarchaeota archaeon]|nr:TIGR04084 family radical SAM/SPASM domain-containing protein [Euryarchaeota archaeon]